MNGGSHDLRTVKLLFPINSRLRRIFARVPLCLTGVLVVGCGVGSGGDKVGHERQHSLPHATGLALYRQSLMRLQGVAGFRLVEMHAAYAVSPGSRICIHSSISIRFQTPNRLSLASRACGPGSSQETQYAVQVAGVACSRRPDAFLGKLANKWIPGPSYLKGGDQRPNMAATVLEMVHLPPGHVGEIVATAGLKEAFGAVSEAKVLIHGKQRLVDALPITSFRVYEGNATGVPNTRERGKLFIDPHSELPLEYVSSTRSEPHDGRRRPYAAEDAQFTYGRVAPVRLPGRGGRGC